MELIVTRLWLMSLQACALILVVLLARLLLKKYPKVLGYSLWALVGLRLLCPVFVESSYSLQPDFEKVSQVVWKQNSTLENMAQENSQNVPDSDEVEADGKTEETVSAENQMPEENRVPGKNPVLEQEPDRQMVVNTGQQLSGNQVMNTITEVPTPKKEWKPMEVLCLVYIAGVCLVAAVYVVQYILVWNRLRTVVKSEEQVYLSDRVSSPFVIGFLQPRIILPYGLKEEERHYILLHERTHIRHHDTLIRGIGALCLCLHWWNPLVWLAVHIMNKDMEMFCDEAALKNVVTVERKKYAETLLNFAMRQSGFSLGLAFGESNAEQRIRNILKNKKRSWIILGVVVAAALLCGVAFLTIPKQETSGEPEPGEATVTPVPTMEPQQSPTPIAVAERKQAHVFTKNEVAATNPVPDYYTLDTLLEYGTVRTVKGILPGAAPGTWYIAENRGVLYYWGCLEGESTEKAELYSYAIFSEEYPLANGIKVGMSKEEILNLYPDMAVVELDGESFPEDPAWNLGFDSTGYPHSHSGDDENLNYQGKEYWYWHDQFDYCLLAEIDGETRQGRAMALALMMRNNKVEAITFYCRNDGTVTPEDWTIEVSVPWELELYSTWKPSSMLLEQVPEPDSYEEKAREAYTKALYELYQEHTLPDGTYVGDDRAEQGTSFDKYAICDIDKDGRDELCVEYLRYTGMATTLIYEYKQETNDLLEEAVFPSFLSFFDNGIAVVQLSHNHSYAVREGRELWPYHLYQYNSVTDAYELFVEVEGWDKFYIQPSVVDFPEEADIDGDGMVYFVNDMPLDEDAYETWFAEVFAGAGKFQVEYQPLTEETISTLLK